MKSNHRKKSSSHNIKHSDQFGCGIGQFIPPKQRNP